MARARHGGAGPRVTAGKLDRRVVRGALAAVAVVAVGVWLVVLSSEGSAAPIYPEAVQKVADWQAAKGECPSGETEAVQLPIGAHGPVDSYLKQFGEAPTAAGAIGCGAVNGSILWYRFPSPAALRGALARHPRLRAKAFHCIKGAELLLDNLLGHDPLPEYCRRLGFRAAPSS